MELTGRAPAPVPELAILGRKQPRPRARTACTSPGGAGGAGTVSPHDGEPRLTSLPAHGPSDRLLSPPGRRGRRPPGNQQGSVQGRRLPSHPGRHTRCPLGCPDKDPTAPPGTRRLPRRSLRGDPSRSQWPAELAKADRWGPPGRRQGPPCLTKAHRPGRRRCHPAGQEVRPEGRVPSPPSNTQGQEGRRAGLRLAGGAGGREGRTQPRPRPSHRPRCGREGARGREPGPHLALGRTASSTPTRGLRKRRVIFA